MDGTFVADVLPAMILLGLGAGMAFNPVLLAAMSDVDPNEAGLASGFVNTVVHDGRRARTRGAGERWRRRAPTRCAAGEAELEALTGGYHAAFLLGALFAAAAAGLGAVLLRSPATSHEGAGAPVVAET